MKSILILLVGLSVSQSLFSQTAETKSSSNKVFTKALSADAIKHHAAIKGYLAARSKSNLAIEQLLILLLENGYSIDDLAKAYFAINAPLGEGGLEGYKAMMRKNDMREADLERRLRRRAAHFTNARRSFVKSFTGITDDILVERLIAAGQVPVKETMEEADYIIRADIVDGEPMLTDADWMTDVHKRVVNNYKGERRNMPAIPVKIDAEEDAAGQTTVVP